LYSKCQIVSSQKAIERITVILGKWYILLVLDRRIVMCI
jgi:hypothetical protein